MSDEEAKLERKFRNLELLDAAVHECSICGALVERGGRRWHLEWHEKRGEV